MRFPEFFKAREGKSAPVLSIEVYPPKTEKAMNDLRSVLPRLVALAPDYMTVTYGALGTTQARTLELASLIKTEFELETASHLTCVGATTADIDRILERIHSLGIENIVALRGDPPQGEKCFVPTEGGFAHGNELVEHIRHTGKFGIAVAGYPEKHLEAPDPETDLRHLVRKVRAGGDIVITQLFFDNRDFFRFTSRLEDLGLGVPVVPGILPVQSLKQIRRITDLCGARIPRELAARLESAADDEAMRQVGVEWAVKQCRELLEGGAPGIHFYVLNRARQMERIIPALGDLLRKSSPDDGAAPGSA